MSASGLASSSREVTLLPVTFSELTGLLLFEEQNWHHKWL